MQVQALHIPVSVYVAGGVGPAHSIAVQAQRKSGCGYSIVVGSAEFAERRVKADLNLSEGLPNVFYGVQTPQDVTITLDNSDGAYSFLAQEEVYGKLVRVRRYDEDTGQILKVFEGEIEEWSVKDEVLIRAVSHSHTGLDTVLPSGVRLHLFGVKSAASRCQRLRNQIVPQPWHLNQYSKYTTWSGPGLQLGLCDFSSMSQLPHLRHGMPFSSSSGYASLRQ